LRVDCCSVAILCWCLDCWRRWFLIAVQASGGFYLFFWPGDSCWDPSSPSNLFLPVDSVGVLFGRMENPALTCQFESKSSSFAVWKLWSHFTWNWGLTKAVLRSRTSATFLLCRGDRPRYIPTLHCCFHLWKGSLDCKVLSRTYTGHPNGM